jgi:hypothetical protein
MCSISINAQITNNTNNPFLGTWEHQDGNEIFRVFLWMDDNSGDIRGHYEKVINNNGIESYVYCSDKEKFQGNNKGWTPYVINTNGDNNVIGGTFIDNTVNANLYHPLKLGSVRIELLSNTNSLVTAQWTVERKKYQGVISSDEAPEFSVPTNIVLTKVE